MIISRSCEDDAVVIDGTTGTVLGYDNLFYCRLSPDEIDSACMSDDRAFECTARGVYIPPSVLEFLLERKNGACVSFDELHQVFASLKMSVADSRDNGDGTFSFTLKAEPRTV